MTRQLTPDQLATYEMIFRHPISRDLEWRDVRALLESVCEATAEPEGERVKFNCNGQTLRVSQPRRRAFSDIRAIMDVRSFLERTLEGPVPAPASASPAPVHEPAD